MAYDELLADRLRTLLTGEPGLSEKKMFGGICFMVDRYMICAITNKGDIMMRVAPEKYEEAISQPDARPMDYTGRVSKGMVYLKDCEATALARWLESAILFVRSLPPKA